MAEVLKEWLTERLKRPIQWHAEEFGNMMKDGYIIAGVLRSYKVINDEQYFLIRSSNSTEDVKNNWEYLSKWLRDLQVYLDESELCAIMSGRGSMLLRLFYQLFLYLDKRDRTDFIKRERKMVSSLVEKVDNRFKVDSVEEKEESFVDDLSRPLLNEKEFIEWQKKKAEQVKKIYEYNRHKYSKTIKNIEESKTLTQNIPYTSAKTFNKERQEMEKFALKHPCKYTNYTYEQLIRLEEAARERKKSIVDSEWAENYMNNLYTKIHKRSESEEFQKRMQNVLSGSLWDLSIADEEAKLDTELAKKVMKLSQFEKQMCTQLMETKQQARNLFQNRVQAEREFADQREQQFNQYLDNVKEQINLEVMEIDFEKQRQNTLHKKLYDEKIKRKRQHYYEICYDTVLSIVDYATKYAYFQKLIGENIPDTFIHEWKTLYFKHQPVFEILDPMEDIFKENDLIESELDLKEEIIILERDRQEALNNSEFLEYHNYSYPWTLELLLPNYDPESEERKYEYLGSRILGHLVYTLLEIKYPYPPRKPPAELPNFSVKVSLRGLPDRSITKPLQSLLDLRRIHVVRLESAINFCLQRFKFEMVGCTDIELSFDKFMATAQKEEDRELIRLIKCEDEVVCKGSEEVIKVVAGISPMNTKQTQTPKTIPEEEIVLSVGADLGRFAYESLNCGDSLTSYLLAAMIVEYLKSQDNIDGFVIVNYPNTYREAQILEETFSGRAPPDENELVDIDNIYLEESIIKHRTKEKDQYKVTRVSKLVNNPHKNRVEKPFDSYFTCYISLKKTDDILQELVIWDLDEQNSELIDRFYAVLGINYSMYYEVMEKSLLAQICKYIIGDFVMPLKTCDKLFGDNVLSELDFPSSDDKRNKSKIIKLEVSDRKSREKLRRASKASKISITNTSELKKPTVLEEQVIDDVGLIEMVAEEKNDQSILSTEEEILLAGEENWEYGQLPIPHIIGTALATCWEQTEKAYIHDIEELFLAKRLQLNCLVPYCRFIKDKMDQIIMLPSQKQDLVSRFQIEYNSFENDWRGISLAKNEWHYRVKELQDKLYQICDERKLQAQQQRQGLITENWAMEELTTMTNTYISCMQTELNRSILTFQVLHDFYFTLIKGMPSTERHKSTDLTKIWKESEELSGSKKGSEDKIYKQLKSAFLELQLKNTEIDYSNNPLNFIIENNVKLALKIIKDTNDSYRSLISKEYSEIAKIMPVTKKKDENTSEASINQEEIFKLNCLKCIEEWIMGINGEMFRASLRFLALQYKCYQDMKIFNDQIYKTFMAVQNKIDGYYINEIKSVDQLCKYLQMAVEDGRKLSESLTLENDTFVIDPNVVQFTEIDPYTGTGEIYELTQDFEFKISQLASLRDHFKIVSSTGIILQQSFIYLLQDFTFFSKESPMGLLFPEIWKRIDPEQIHKLVYLLFGDIAFIDWRDFLIYCLNLRFPTLEELLETRKHFRCKDLDSTELISRDDYMLEKLWFEKEFDPENKHQELRNNLVKHFLFQLYEVSCNQLNYSAFLLAFCKSVDPVEGFATSLSMAIGKKTCYNLPNCIEVINKLIKNKQYKDACIACAHKCTTEFLDKVLVTVVNICEGTTVIELEHTLSPPDVGKKGEKGVKGGTLKTQKVESASARLPKQKSAVMNRNKVAHSATDVKTTYSYRPCEKETETAEENTQEKEMIEEEHKKEPQENDDVAYVVSQSVIWNVLRTCLPWHFKLLPEQKVTIYMQQVQDAMNRLEMDTDNGDIYVAKFVSDPNIYKILHNVKKFTALNIVEEVQKCLS